ncbi:MAG: coiled-coil domain-containing protein [Thiohalospira sp.]
MEEQNKNQNEKNKQQKNDNHAPVPPKKPNKNLKFILWLLIVLLGVVTFLYINQMGTTKKIETALIAEKDSLQTHLLQLRDEYDSLMTDNDTLNAQLISEQEKIDDLLAEIKTVKATNYARIKKLQDELGTLRKVAKSYVRQIDSLNTMNQALVAENIKVKNEFNRVVSSKNELEEQNKDLSGKVEMASVLRTENVRALPLNRRGKENNRINKIEKIKVDFTIKENVLAEPGERVFYIRIAGPDDYILAKSEDDLFEYQGQDIVFSAKRPVDYNNEKMDITIYWDNNGTLIPGNYDVYIFADGNEIGITSFEIEESGWF